jgi:uncharacterized Zn-binding protein involved in type VI secretion
MAGMPAARILDTMSDGGMITGPGDSTVIIDKMPAAVLGDMFLWPAGASTGVTTGAFAIGSTTVMIGKKPAIRLGDTQPSTGTSPVVCSTTVLIG